MCDVVYGAYHGGDPRTFHPDPECSTEVEREAHRRACAIFAEHETLPPPSHELVADDLGRLLMHIAHGRFGLGVYEMDCGDPECPGSEAYAGDAGKGDGR